MNKKVSKHAEELRKRGFKSHMEIDPEAASGTSTDPADVFAAEMKQQALSMKGASRADRRKMKAMKAQGFFLRTRGHTHAVDEHGEEWLCDKEVSLADLGFIDNGPLLLEHRYGVKAN